MALTKRQGGLPIPSQLKLVKHSNLGNVFGRTMNLRLSDVAKNVAQRQPKAAAAQAALRAPPSGAAPPAKTKRAKPTGARKVPVSTSVPPATVPPATTTPKRGRPPGTRNGSSSANMPAAKKQKRQ